jgi:Rab-GTPase-TBC domain
VLQTYVKRNPTVGYCQGMNFIVGRMLQYMNEEQAFWTLAMIIESILPLDYYSNMVGILVDQKVFNKLVQKHLNKLHYHLKLLNFDPSMLSFQWFVCFFAHNLTPEVSYYHLIKFLGIFKSVGLVHAKGCESFVQCRNIFARFSKRETSLVSRFL